MKLAISTALYLCSSFNRLFLHHKSSQTRVEARKHNPGRSQRLTVWVEPPLVFTGVRCRLRNLSALSCAEVSCQDCRLEIINANCNFWLTEVTCWKYQISQTGIKKKEMICFADHSLLILHIDPRWRWFALAPWTFFIFLSPPKISANAALLLTHLSLSVATFFGVYPFHFEPLAGDF